MGLRGERKDVSRLSDRSQLQKHFRRPCNHIRLPHVLQADQKVSALPCVRSRTWICSEAKLGGRSQCNADARQSRRSRRQRRPVLAGTRRLASAAVSGRLRRPAANLGDRRPAATGGGPAGGRRLLRRHLRLDACDGHGSPDGDAGRRRQSPGARTADLVAAAVVGALKATRGPGEPYGDVILRLAGEGR